MHKSEAVAKRILLMAPAASEPRLRSLIEAVSPRAELVGSDGLEADLTAFDAVVLEGDQSGIAPRELERLIGYVQEGGSLVALGAAPREADDPLTRLLGHHMAGRLPFGEFFGRLAVEGHELLRNLRPEFAFVDAFAPLEATNGATRPLIEVSVHFRNRVAVAEHLLGNGRVLVSALGVAGRAFESADLRLLLQRSLRRPNEGADDRRIGVAIIGYGPLGGVGFAHASAVERTAGLELVAFCDSNAARLESASADFPAAAAYASADELIDDPRVDAAIVATPPSSHTDLCLRLLRAGKHVICEKPLCFTLAEADQLFDTALANGLVLTVNQNRRWDADFLTLTSVVESGGLGEVFNVETFVGSFEHPCREWHSDAAISGGAEFDWGAHYIDWILQLMPGLPRSVAANGHKRVWHDVSNLDQVRVRLHWEDDREAEFLHSDVAAVRRPKFYVQGTTGTLVGHYRPLISERIEPGRGYVREESHHAEAPADLTLVRYEPLGGGLREERLPLLPSDPFAFYRNFADHLLFDEPPLAVEHASTRKLIAVLEAAHRSAEQGGRPLTPA